MEKLDTIQKRGNLNKVYATGEKTNGGAYHNYRVSTNGKNLSLVVTDIEFQHGGRNQEGSTTGVLDTDLLEIVRHRLQCFQAGEYATEDNQEALEHIEKALIALNKRVEDRIKRGVLGKEAK